MDTSRPGSMIRTARFALALLALFAIGWQLTLHLRAGFSALNFFSYFTNLSNLFAAGVLLAASRTGATSARLEVLRFAAAVTMAIVGIVFSTLLRNVDLGALLPWINVVVHYVMPVYVVLDFVIAPPSRRVEPRHLLNAAAFPLAYLGYVLLRGAATGWYPYPFTNPGKVGGYGAVALYAIGIALTYFAVGALLMALANLRSEASHGSR